MIPIYEILRIGKIIQIESILEIDGGKVRMEMDCLKDKVFPLEVTNLIEVVVGKHC